MSELSRRMEMHIKTNTAGLWITIALLGGLLVLPVQMDAEWAGRIGMGLFVGMAIAITSLIRYNKLKKEPFLVLSAEEIRCLPLFGKAWAVPADQISGLEMNDKVLRFERGQGGKKYMIPLKPLSPEDRAKLDVWVKDHNGNSREA
jgi:hypothetical protein